MIALSDARATEHAAESPAAATGLLVKDYRGKDAHQVVWRFDSALESVAAERKGMPKPKLLEVLFRTRQILALVLAALLSGNCFGQGQPSSRPSPKEQATVIAANSPVEVKFVDGSKQRGWISEVSDAGFVLRHKRNNQMEMSKVSFTQVVAVKQIKDVKPAHTTRNIFIGVGIVLAALEILDGILHSVGCC
jgi:hypothetical protein